MSSPLVSRAIPLTQITVAAASITNTYSSVGSFSSPVELMIIISTLDQPVQLSFDGTNDHIAVPAGSTVPVFMELNFKTNRMVMPGSPVMVKEIGNPTTGSIYVSAFSAVVP